MQVVPYKPEHKPGIEKICQETFAGGRPIPEEFAEPFVHSVLHQHLKAGWGFVGVENGEVQGYLLGAHTKPMTFSLLGDVAKMLIYGATGVYAGDESADMRKFIETMPALIKHSPKMPKGLPEIHLNVREAYKSQGLAHALRRAWEQEIEHSEDPARRADGYFGGVWSSPKHHTPRSFERLGFSIYSAAPINPWVQEGEHGELLIVKRDVLKPELLDEIIRLVSKESGFLTLKSRKTIKQYTPQEVIAEVRAGTPFGRMMYANHLILRERYPEVLRTL
ncbi:MAG: hypothetical protein ABIA93_02650 [Candidatus Woesearchaeota archaeon]